MVSTLESFMNMGTNFGMPRRRRIFPASFWIARIFGNASRLPRSRNHWRSKIPVFGEWRWSANSLAEELRTAHHRHISAYGGFRFALHFAHLKLAG